MHIRDFSWIRTSRLVASAYATYDYRAKDLPDNAIKTHLIFLLRVGHFLSPNPVHPHDNVPNPDQFPSENEVRL